MKSSTGFIIGIENKPWAKEGPDQVRDYLAELQQRAPNNHLLIYLSGNGSDPSKSLKAEEISDLKKSNRLQVGNYWNVMEGWLGDCVTSCTKDQVQPFLQYFCNYVSVERVMSEIAEYILQVSSNRLAIALAVAESVSEIRERIMVGFLSALRDKVAKLLDKGIIVEHDREYGTYIGVTARVETWPYKVRIETQSKGCKFILGVENLRQKTTKEPKFPDLVAALDRALGRGNTTHWWEWSIPLDSPFGGPDAEKILLKIHGETEKAVDLLAERIEKVFTVVNGHAL